MVAQPRYGRLDHSSFFVNEVYFLPSLSAKDEMKCMPAKREKTDFFRFLFVLIHQQ